MAQPAPVLRYIVRHGSMRFLGDFAAPPGRTFGRLDNVILETERGTELGQVLCLTTPEALRFLPEKITGHILRAATPEDLKHAENLRAKRNADYELARKLIMEHRLPMQLVDTERLFGGERVIFYFLAERRVDFRELVRSMAREFQSRIELRHIGIRDEARLLADYGDCGRPVCCNTFLTVMPSVTMRMAKIQKATLDPNKISGRCGRLKCCLRYEQDVYDEHLKGMPEVGMRVLTREGQGLVLYQEPLARRLLVEFEDGRRLPIPANEIISQLGFAPGYQAQTDGDI